MANKCLYCGKELDTKYKYCNSVCARKQNYVLKAKQRADNARCKSLDGINHVLVEASKQGLTYGQYINMLNIKAKGVDEMKKRILKYRAKHNISQREFAKRCGLSFVTINSIENGYQSPSKLTIAKIERILNSEE